MLQKLGHDMRRHFCFEGEWCNINNGSFGSTPKVICEQMRRYQQEAEARPDSFLRYDAAEKINVSRAVVAKQLGVPTSTIVLIPNATTGINLILRNLKYEPEDVIIYFSTTYGACQNIVMATVEYGGCKAHRIELQHPMSDADVLQRFEADVEELSSKGLRSRVLLLDTFCSLPAVRMPYEALVKACEKYQMFSVVDGAHGYGHSRLDLADLNPDFYVSNCHKWGFVPRPAAVFYVPERNQKLIRTSFPTSHYFEPAISAGAVRGPNPLPPPSGDDTKFTKMFEFVGTYDVSAYCCIPDALEFRRTVCGGEEHIFKYCKELAKSGGALVASKLGTEILDNKEGTLTKDCLLVNIRLPLSPETVQLGEKEPLLVVQWGQKATMEYDTFIPFFWLANAWWVRISAQVYLDLSDYERAATVITSVCQRIRSGEHVP